MSIGLSVAFVGEMRMYTKLVVPLSGLLEPVTGWLVCNGQLVSATTYDDLFALAGHSFNGGVDPGGSQFRLPDMRMRGPIGLHSSGTFVTRGATGGETDVALDYTKVPGHLHSFTLSTQGVHSHTGSTGTETPNHSHGLTINYGSINAGSGPSTNPQFIYNIGSGNQTYTATESNQHNHTISATAASPASHTHTITINQTGTSGTPLHNNISPWVGLVWMVKY